MLSGLAASQLSRFLGIGHLFSLVELYHQTIIKAQPQIDLRSKTVKRFTVGIAMAIQPQLYNRSINTTPMPCFVRLPYINTFGVYGRRITDELSGPKHEVNFVFYHHVS